MSKNEQTYMNSYKSTQPFIPDYQDETPMLNFSFI